MSCRFRVYLSCSAHTELESRYLQPSGVRLQALGWTLRLIRTKEVALPEMAMIAELQA